MLECAHIPHMCQEGVKLPGSEVTKSFESLHMGAGNHLGALQ